MKANLMIHAGGQLATWADICALATPPAIGKHVPVGHSALVERIQRYLQVDGFSVIDAQWAIAKAGARFFGLMQLSHPSLMSQDHAYVMGIRNSHDKAFAASVCVGLQPFVCDNLAFSPGADGLAVTRRHVGSIYADLNSLVGSLVEKLATRFALADNRVDHYRNATLDQRDADHFILELYRNNVIKPTDIYRLASEYDGTVICPGKVQFRHDEFAPRNAYSLFNALTQLLKGIDKEGNANPDLWSLPKTTADAYTVFDRLTGFGKPIVDIVIEPAMQA